MIDVRKICYEAILEVLDKEESKNFEYKTISDEMEIYGRGFGLDSLDLVELINILEEKLKIELTMEELMEAEAFENFGTLWKFIARKVGQ